jgi:hypothetical protein
MVEFFCEYIFSVFVSAVLVDFFDGDCFSCMDDFGLEYYAEGAVAAYAFNFV